MYYISANILVKLRERSLRYQRLSRRTQHTSAYVSIHASNQNPTTQPTISVSIREHTWNWAEALSIREHTWAYVSIRQHTWNWADALGRQRSALCPYISCISFFSRQSRAQQGLQARTWPPGTQLLRCQCLKLCISKASKLSTCHVEQWRWWVIVSGIDQFSYIN